MSYYHPGYHKAHQRVVNMTTKDELYAVLDELYGRGNLSDDPLIDEIRTEAIAQVQREYTDTNSNEYQIAQVFIQAHKDKVFLG